MLRLRGGCPQQAAALLVLQEQNRGILQSSRQENAAGSSPWAGPLVSAVAHRAWSNLAVQTFSGGSAAACSSRCRSVPALSARKLLLVPALDTLCCNSNPPLLALQHSCCHPLPFLIYSYCKHLCLSNQWLAQCCLSPKRFHTRRSGMNCR